MTLALKVGGGCPSVPHMQRWANILSRTDSIKNESYVTGRSEQETVPDL